MEDQRGREEKKKKRRMKEEREKQGKKNHRRERKEAGIGRNGVGRREKEDTRMRKVDSEVYTVRRDLINPPELFLEDVSSFPSVLYTEGCAVFARRLCALSRAEQVSSNGLFRPMEDPFFSLSSPVNIYLAFYYFRIVYRVKKWLKSKGGDGIVPIFFCVLLNIHNIHP